MEHGVKVEVKVGRMERVLQPLGVPEPLKVGEVLALRDALGV